VTRRWSTAQVIDAVTDAGSMTSWDEDLRSGDPLRFSDTRSYAERLAAAVERANTSEAVITGTARIAGRRVVLVVGAFDFLAGTQGVVVGERVARAFDRATALGLPVVGLPASGGTRMQEGSLAFVQMLKIAASVGRHRRRGGRYVAWLRDPTTGGSLASWASLAQLTWAEPGALIGLTGPRVIAATEGAALPDDVQRAEHLATHGVVDEVVAPSELGGRLRGALDVLGPVPPPGDVALAWPDDPGPAQDDHPPSGMDAWTAVQRSRRRDRAGVRALLAHAAEVTPLSGDDAGRRDEGCLTVVCRIAGARVVLVAHDRRIGERGARLDAVGYRQARRAMVLADELGLPLVTVVDTPGAAATVEAESGGTAREIARGMVTMAGLTVPTVAVLLGEGSGGGAIAWLAADRVVAAAHAWLAPIAPEGASAILFRSTDRAADVARGQAITPSALRWMGLVDEVVPDDGTWIAPLVDELGAQLAALAAQAPDERLVRRADRLRWVGAAGR
jgi:acetyl-CoA carboxylase carboxyl transferase beta subunit